MEEKHNNIKFIRSVPRFVEMNEDILRGIANRVQVKLYIAGESKSTFLVSNLNSCKKLFTKKVILQKNFTSLKEVHSNLKILSLQKNKICGRSYFFQSNI